ncbi:MAG TPA: hypothetical protein PKY59_02455 [Pyrinomonadaceae bacterium]|nr:hypothetical protein [Pyrinomonadaceae bacterium]
MKTNLHLTIILTTFLFLLSIYSKAQNQPGTFDQSFGQNGILTINPPAGSIQTKINDMTVQSDGKIVIIGQNSGNSFFAFVSRYNADGTPDQTFGNNGTVLLQANKVELYSVLIQPDGKIVAAGLFTKNLNTYYLSSTDFFVARFNSNGNLDTTFGLNGIVRTSLENFEEICHAYISKLLLQNDGKIITLGTKSSLLHDRNSDEARESLAVVRYLPNGRVDTTFGNYGIVTTLEDAYFDFPTGVIQPDGKLLAFVQSFGNRIFESQLNLYRFNSDGTTDNSFAYNGILQLSDSIKALGVGISPNNQIILLSQSKLYQINLTGQIDYSFANPDVRINGFVFNRKSLAIQDDGKLFVFGNSFSADLSQYNATLSCFMPNGEINTTFGENGIVVQPLKQRFYSEKSLIQSDGKILVAGYTLESPTIRIVLMRFWGDRNTLNSDAKTMRNNSLKK